MIRLRERTDHRLIGAFLARTYCKSHFPEFQWALTDWFPTSSLQLTGSLHRTSQFEHCFNYGKCTKKYSLHVVIVGSPYFSGYFLHQNKLNLMGIGIYPISRTFLCYWQNVTHKLSTHAWNYKANLIKILWYNTYHCVQYVPNLTGHKSR